MDSFEELVNKAKDIKAKAAFQPYSFIWKTNQYYLQDNRPEPKKIKNNKDNSIKSPKFGDSKTKPHSSLLGL